MDLSWTEEKNSNAILQKQEKGHGERVAGPGRRPQPLGYSRAPDKQSSAAESIWIGRGTMPKTRQWLNPRQTGNARAATSRRKKADHPAAGAAVMPRTCFMRGRCLNHRPAALRRHK